MKILVMSHFKLAEGIKNTISYFNEEAANKMTVINAYATHEFPKEDLKKFIDSVEVNETVIIFTDIMGGSVNQLCLPYISSNVHVFTGMNFPMILQATCMNDNTSKEEISALEKLGKEAVVYMNEYKFETFSEDDE